MKLAQRKLAIRALKEFGVMPQVIESLASTGSRFYSEYQGPVFDAVLYHLDNKPAWEKLIKELEDKYGIYVYHCVHYHAEYGEILDCLYIPRIDEDFDEDAYFNAIVKEGIAAIYAINFDEPDFSEFGTGCYVAKMGGLLKTE